MCCMEHPVRSKQNEESNFLQSLRGTFEEAKLEAKREKR